MHFIPPLLQGNAFCKSLMLYSAQAKLTEVVCFKRYIAKLICKVERYQKIGDELSTTKNGNERTPATMQQKENSQQIPINDKDVTSSARLFCFSFLSLAQFQLAST